MTFAAVPNRPFGVLVGWSYGGLVVTDYVRHYGESKVGAINYVAALTSSRTDSALAGIGARFAEIVRGLMSEDYDESVAAQAVHARLCVREEPDPEIAYRMLGYSVVVPPHVRADLLRRVVDNDEVLPSLTVPTLVTHGGCDEIVLPATAERTLELVTHAEPSWYREVGHSPFWEEPERFNDELRELAEDVPDLAR